MTTLDKAQKPTSRILIVTPEITYLPAGMGNMANYLSAKAGGLADVSASLVTALFNLGADVHVALPHFRRLFNIDVSRFIDDELRVYKKVLPDTRIHLAQDRIFFYQNNVYASYGTDNPKAALAFQREVINHIVPLVNPDLIHCNDWMTGLVPGMARRHGIPCLFTIHNIHTFHMALAEIEDRGIDAAEFWNYLYYKWPTGSYEQTRDSNPVDFLASGIFASHFINTVSPTFLDEVVQGRHDFVPPGVRAEVRNKKAAGCAFGILNAPDPAFDPQTDETIPARYGPDNHVAAKRANKEAFQEVMGLAKDPAAPLLFWPSRLDPSQKGCELLTDILYRTVSTYWKDGLQLAIVANGPYQRYFHDIVRFHDFYERVSIRGFDETLSHLGYAGSDFVVMPSLFEPCGLPQMIGCLYGALPIVHDTGGLHDTVSHLRPREGRGNGFVFEVYDANGLFWAIGEAMTFFRMESEARAAQVARIMRESASRFNHATTAQQYIELYEAMLDRPLVNPY